MIATFLSATDFAIVFIHLGPNFPEYGYTAINQARLFNPECPIYLIANEEALNNFSHPTVTKISSASLVKSEAHEKFLKEAKTTGFWHYVVERFYYLDELIDQHRLKNVFHLENDVMLYRDLRELLPTFENRYKGMIGGTFDNDSRCIAGFIYIENSRPLSEFVKFAASKIYTGENDMHLLGMFRESYYKKFIDHLPIIDPSYGEDNPLESYSGKTAEHPDDYSNQFGEFLSIFDAAALGQYLGGLDPIHKDHDPGFINESSLFNPANINVIWERDPLGRQVPIARYKKRGYPINNLHIHSKNLPLFSSLRREPNPTIETPPPTEKTTYPLSPDPIDAIIYAEEKNKNTLDLCIESLKTFGKNIRRIVVISTTPLTDRAEWFDEKNFPFTKTSILTELYRSDPYETRRYPYHPRNQLQPIFTCLSRLYAPVVIPNLSTNLLILEPDIIFLNPIEFMSHEGEPFFNPRVKSIPKYGAHALQLLPDFIHGHFKEIGHFALLQQPVHQDLFEKLKEKHQKEPWEAICNKLDRQNLYQSCFSDFSLYGNYALLRTEQAHLKPQKWRVISDVYNLSTFQDQGYTYVRYLPPGCKEYN